MANIETPRQEHRRVCLREGDPFCDWRWCGADNGDVWLCEHGEIVKHTTDGSFHSLRNLRNRLGSRKEYRRALKTITREDQS